MARAGNAFAFLVALSDSFVSSGSKGATRGAVVLKESVQQIEGVVSND